MQQIFFADLGAEVWSLSSTFVQTMSKRFCQDFEVVVQARFISWSLFRILLLLFCRGCEVDLGRGSETRFGQDFKS